MKRVKWASFAAAILLLCGLALFLMARQVWQPEPVTLRILKQDVGIYTGHDGELVSSANGTVLNNGNFIKAGQNASAALLYFESSTVKLDGPAEAQHLWSRSRKIRTNLVNQLKYYFALVGNRFFRQPAPAQLTGTGRSIASEVLYGKAIVSASRDNDPGSLYQLWFPGGVIATRGATFTANVDPERGTVIEVHQGSITVGSGAVDKETRPVIAVTRLTAGMAVSIPPLPHEWRQDQAAYSLLMEKIRKIVENSINLNFGLTVEGATLAGLEAGNGTAIYTLDLLNSAAGLPPVPPALPAGYQTLADPLIDTTYLILGKTTNIQMPVLPSAVGREITRSTIKREKPPVYVSSIDDISKPLGVAVDPFNQHIFVTESAGSRTTICFNANRSLLFTLSPPGTQPGDRAPSYVAVDSRTGIIYISDRNRHEIDMYDTDGTYLGIFHPLNDSTSWSPLGLSFVNGYLYVTDVSDLQQRVLIIDPSSREIKLEFGSEGKQIGQISFANDAVADTKGQIYVADSDNFRVQVFSQNGQALGGFSRWGQGSLGLPRGMDAQGDYIYLVDAFDQLVHVFDVENALKPVFNFGKPGTAVGQFNYPNDVAIERDQIIIADRQNNRLQIWNY